MAIPTGLDNATVPESRCMYVMSDVVLPAGARPKKLEGLPTVISDMIEL